MVPRKVTQGDDFNFSVEAFTDGQGRYISVPDWTFNFYVRGNSNNLDATSLGYNFSINSATSKTLKPGRGQWQIIAVKTSTGEQTTVDRGFIDVLPDLSISGVDPRTQDEKDLEQVDSCIRQIIQTGGVVEFKIGTRSQRKYDLADLQRLRSSIKSRIIQAGAKDAIERGEGNPFAKYVRFK